MNKAQKNTNLHTVMPSDFNRLPVSQRASAADRKYAEAVAMYAATAEPLKSIALRHGITYNSLLGYVLRNCPQERESHKKMVALASVAV